MQFHTLTIVGVGLIGGSIGLAAKQRGIVQHVRGVGRASDKLRRAQQLGAIDSYALDLAAGVQGAQIVVFCTPVDQIAEQVLSVRDHYAPEALITDAGSTKASITQRLEHWQRKDVFFVGSHPLAGSEKQGVEHSRADLFLNRWTVLTPAPSTAAHAVERVRAFWHGLGAKTRLMPADEHDRALAMTSHLPHLLASALAGLLPAEWIGLAATGFRDTTRIAAGDPAVWTPIFLQNHAALSDALCQLESRLQLFRQALASQEAPLIDTLLAQGKKVRDALGS